MEKGRFSSDPPARTNYIREYYAAIQTGSVVVGKWITLIYQRIVEGIDSGAYIYSPEKAETAIEWISKHAFHTEGPLAPQPLILELWQKALISCIFGILDPETGKRMFREVVLIVARKNGKSLLASAIAKYIWYESGYGSRVFCVAPKLAQADIIYNSIWLQTQLDPEWKEFKQRVAESIKYHERKQIDDTDLARHRVTDLYIPARNAMVNKIAFSAKKSDGFNPSLTICDEIASWQGDAGLKQYEVMKSAMGAREMGDEPSILFSCSTAGYINDSIYDELFKRATHFLLGDSEERKLLPFLYTIDDITKWDDLEELRKSNPNLGVSVSADYLREEIAVARGSLSKKAEFICKYANLKQNSTSAFLEYEVVDSCFGVPLNLEDFRGCYAIGGIDLSQTTDLTSCCVVIERDGKLHVFSHFFMPAERLSNAIAEDGVPYNIYLQQGYLSLSGENYVDYQDCYQWFVDLLEKYEIYVLQIGYDRYSAQYLCQALEQYGFHTDSVIQSFNLTSTIYFFEGTIRDGNFCFGDNQLLKVHLLNSALKSDTEVNKVRLVKVGNNTRIDGMAALLDALAVRGKYYAEIGEQLKNE